PHRHAHPGRARHLPVDRSHAAAARRHELHRRARAALRGVAPVAHVRGDAAVGRAMTWLPPLLIRLTVGVLFVLTGFTAVTSLDDVTAFFVKLGIPLASANAVLVSFGELVCGALLVVGFLSRLAAVPLIVFMLVALATAKAPKVHGLTDLLMQPELGYIVMLVAIAVLGAGTYSVDGYRARRIISST